MSLYSSCNHYRTICSNVVIFFLQALQNNLQQWCPVEKSEHPCSDVSYGENSSAHPKGISLMTQPEIQNFVYRLYVVSQNSFKRLPPWDWERKNIHIAVMHRLVSGHTEDLMKPLRTPLSGWQETMLCPRMLLTVRHISLIRLPWRLAAGHRDTSNV